MVETIFMDPFFTNIILPFLLVFVVIFAVLRKSKILGSEQKYADIIVAAVTAFIFVGVPQVVGFTLKFVPIIAVIVVIILCYYLIFGFLGIHQKPGIMIALGILFGVAFIGTVLWATGVLSQIHLSEGAIGTIIMLVVLGGAIALIASTAKQSGGSSG